MKGSSSQAQQHPTIMGAQKDENERPTAE